MPVPKKRHSNTRTRTRRANWKLKKQNLGECPNCHAVVRPHFACAKCGMYQGRMVLKIKAAKPTKEEKAKA
jgi:large subunit ribosomal protein L32